MARFAGRRGSGARSAGRKRGRAAKGSAKKRVAKKGKAGDRVVDPRATLAVLIAVIALLVGAALFPLRWLGTAAEVFPAGNPVGEVGGRLKVLLVTWLGLGRAAVPLGLLAAAASTGGWWGPAVRRCLWILAA
ncbi:MAG: hypothetical protein F4Z32_16305, partial [Gemmatimonadetes bacterium]|nr:hypothetical protein [Gemmatimonadota bacterium]